MCKTFYMFIVGPLSVTIYKYLTAAVVYRSLFLDENRARENVCMLITLEYLISEFKAVL
jgi:hypothetical protein